LNSEISEKISYLREQADAFMSVNTAKAIIFLSEAMNYIEADEEKLKSECGLQLALAYHKIKEELMAIKIINQCLELKINSDSLKNQIPFNELAAEIYTAISIYDNALEHLLNIASAYTSSKDKQKLGLVLNQIGETHKLLGGYNEAIRHHEKALKIFEELDNKEQLSITNFYIGNCYNWADELDIAFNYLDTGLKLAEKLRSAELKIKPLGSLAILFTKQNKFEKALDNFFQAIDNSNLAGNVRVKADLLKSLGNLYNQMHRHDEAIKILLEADEICHSLNIKQPLHLVNLFLSDAYAALNNFEKALAHHKIYYKLCREIQSEDINHRTKSLQLKFDLEEIQREKNKAEESLLLKDTFLANVSHELRTPLNGIIGMADLLSETVATDENKKYVQTILTSAFQLSDIVDEILDYARLNTGQVIPVEQPFILNETIKDCLDKFLLKFPGKKVESDTDFEACDEVLLDKGILEKVVFNTLVFGGSFASNDKLELALYHSQNKIFINVKFNIVNKKSFPHPDNFFELNNPQFSQNGLNGYGLGLSLINARGMIMVCGGKISVKLESSKCNFVVELPYKAIKSDRKNMVGEPFTAIEDVSILLVEDNKINQFLAKTMLLKKGYKVALATDGEEAIRLLENGNFSMVITDVQMPGMDGYQLAGHIRSKLHDPVNKIPILALTAYESSTEKEKAKAAGMSGFLTKPYMPEQLFELIAQHLPLKSDNLTAAGEPESTYDVNEIYDNLLALMAGDKKETTSLIKMLQIQFPELLSEMLQAIEDKDMKKLYKAAHKIKSSLKIFNNNSVGVLIDQVERKAKDNEYSFELSVKVSELIKQVNVIIGSLNQLIKK
jgi:CheY-like chemotaxis protein/HPt (histidine-containing phosphotransfer) domain-containing protein